MAITDTARQAQRKAQHWELVGSADASYGVHHGVTNDAIVRYVTQNRWPLYGVTDNAAQRSYINGVRRRLRCGARGGREDEIDGGLHRSGCWHARCAHVCACAVVGFCPCCFSASLI